MNRHALTQANPQRLRQQIPLKPLSLNPYCYSLATAVVSFPTELFQENPVFFLEVFNDSLLVSAHPTGDRDEQELELRRHRGENLSKVLVAQSSI
jgi:hypothetical protein